MYFGEDDGSDSDQESTATTTKTKGVDRPQGGPHQKKGQKKGVRSVLSFRVSLRLSLCKSSSVSPVSVFLLLSRVSLARLLRKQLIMPLLPSVPVRRQGRARTPGHRFQQAHHRQGVFSLTSMPCTAFLAHRYLVLVNPGTAVRPAEGYTRLEGDGGRLLPRAQP